VRTAAITAVAVALFTAGSMLAAQEHGPTVAMARAAVFTPPASTREALPWSQASASCGSTLKNAALLGIGLSLATAMIELTYTIVREPFVRNGHDVPGADPRLIAWAGGAGFVAGIIGTEVCRRRRR
jgi:hypothetical protein